MPKYTSRSEGHGTEGGWLPVVGILLVLALLIGAVYWVFTSTQANRLKPIAYGAAFDVSQSMQDDERRKCIGVMNEMIDSFFAESIRVKVWRYAEHLREVADKEEVRRSEELFGIYEDRTLKVMGEWGTHPSLPMKEMLKFVQEPKNKQRQVVLCFFTDGEDHSPQETRKVAEQLAQQDHLKAILVGPLKEQYRLKIQRTLEPLEKAQKLIVFSAYDAGNAIEELKKRLE